MATQRLPEAEDGDGEFTYTLTGLPGGLSFDPDTRILSGTVAAGEYTLTYTATDEAGVQDSQTFTLTVRAAPSDSGSQARIQSRDVSGQSEDINWRRPNIRNLHVGRKQYSQPSAPGLQVSWATPDMSRDTSGDNLTLNDIEQYQLRYKRSGQSLWTHGSVARDSRSVALTGLAAGANYRVDVRVKYSGNRYPEWTFFNATTNTPPKLAAGSLNPTYILRVGRRRLGSKN